MRRIYLDYNATTPVDPRVCNAMDVSIKGIYGNPSSIHMEGRDARKVLDEAREDVASLLSCSPSEIIFTGSGSESNNLAIKGVAETCGERGKHIVTSKVEHPSVLNTFQYLEKKGWDVTWLDVNSKGNLNLKELESAIRDDTALVSLMMANNETGVIFPIKEAAALTRGKGAIFHTDAVQAVGKIEVDVNALGVDLLSLAAHKFYGPKGVGALYVRSGVKLEPIVHGGGQELGRRAGTENLTGIGGLAGIARITKDTLADEMAVIGRLKSLLKEGLKENIDGVVFHADHADTLPNTLSVGFKNVSGESLLMALDLKGVAVSAGSACASGALHSSHVLIAMGLDEEVINGTLRISLGRWTTREEVEEFLNILPPIVRRLLEEK